jgi:(p)ppGpp synthase/HD superfamily hydrolase
MEIVERARAFAAEIYDSPSQLDHPSEVAELVKQAGADEEVQAAAVLHDLLEDTDADRDRIASEFGSRVAALVDAMTEDESIEDYAARKEEHRRRARDAGRDVALLFVADKLSNARRMRHAAKQPEARKLGHYGATLATMREAYPDLSLLDELDAELRGLGDDLQRSPA